MSVCVQAQYDGFRNTPIEARDHYRSNAVTPYANIYSDDDTIEVTLTTGGTYYQIGALDSAVSTSHFTTDTVNHNIQLLSEPGTYFVGFSASFKGTVSTTFHIAAFKNTAKLKNVAVERSIGTANQTGDTYAAGIVTLAVGDSLDIRASAVANTKTATFNHMSLTVFKILGVW